ncbi:hypothetical protein R7127_13710 [Vibrio sp. 1159]|uniref:hypothetical protein n=1 Tax=unclassified Vibrio TaxID=2614977 RepID=UPI0021CE6CB1|nr:MULTISPECIES: hypothetical protein [unclassified Vibrio]EKA5858997.1 hypothetical protein [Vibrio alginolyticus]MDW2311618.1 hypothetical protein [Vibrio sp. 1075]MDW2321334.1 hypothetical protein [Vibrio sp. 1159]MDW2403546.1 hypothetical protein [Vibrio sp. 1262-1]
MYIVELNYPGTWLQFEDQDSKHEIETMLRSLEGIVTEAAISLSMYEQAVSAPRDHRKEMERDRELREVIDNQIREEAGEDYYLNFEQYRLKSEKQLRIRKAELGIIPSSYLHKIPFIHAHTFVYAVDSFGKFLEELAQYKNIPKSVQNCLDEFNRLLPSVRKIRNSALHIEDRSRGYGTWKDKKKGKKMETSGFLGLSNLEGNFLCYTIDDGTYQKVEISVNVLNILGQIMNHLLASFQWEGSPRIEPYY